MNKKKLLAILLSGAMALSLAACGSDTSNDTTTDTSGDGAATAGNYTVGICQQMQHAALDEATQGFQDKLTELVTAAGGTVEFDPQNASGESSNAATIINGFVSSGVDLIMANGTTSLQAAQAGTTDIPILGTSITDYATALQMENWTGTSGTNISGTTDLAPLEDQAQMLLDLFPDAQNVGLLYCSAEPNSVYQVNIVREYLEGQGLTCTDYTVDDYVFASDYSGSQQAVSAYVKTLAKTDADAAGPLAGHLRAAAAATDDASRADELSQAASICQDTSAAIDGLALPGAADITGASADDILEHLTEGRDATRRRWDKLAQLVAVLASPEGHTSSELSDLDNDAGDVTDPAIDLTRALATSASDK